MPLFPCNGYKKYAGQKRKQPSSQTQKASVFDSMLAELAVPALPASQQLQVVLCVSQGTQTLSVATIYTYPNATMHACTVRPNQDGPAYD